MLPVATVDRAVLRAFAGDALEPEVISVIVDAVFKALQPEEVAANLAELKADLRELEVHLDRPAIEQKVQARVARWRELVASAVVSDGR